jgi:hypothetical protein
VLTACHHRFLHFAILLLAILLLLLLAPRVAG